LKRPLCYLVRHGSTNDSAKNIFRGQRNSALDKKGFLDAHSLKEFFHKKEWHRIFCSPMMRAIQTATIICDDQEDYQPEALDGLEPWDVGFLTGLPKNEENKKKMDGFVAHPDSTPKDGESLADFQHRVWPIIASAIELGWKQDVPCIMVVHSSIIHSFNHLMEGIDHDDKAVEPGGVMEVYFEDGEIKHAPILKETEDDSALDPKNAS
jgi:broad specificity phosphatase PhoE